MSETAIAQTAAPAESASRAFLRGMRAGLPVTLAVLPFGLLFGAVAVQNGFTVFEATLMTATVFGGASQMVGLQLFGEKIAPALIVLSILAVNFRHVLYSAAMGRLVRTWTTAEKALGFFVLTDPQFAQAEREYDRAGSVRFAWYMGLGFGIYVPWVVEGLLGALFGRLLPDTHATGIDFLLPIYFLGILMEFRHRPLWLPVLVVSAAASMASFRFIGSPWHVTVGAVAGVAAAALWPVKGRSEA